MAKLTHLDLCSGIGGFALAARWAGIETVAFCEIDPFCRKVLKKHWPDVFIYEDIKILNPLDGRLDGRQVDILTAGFPCQPFSVAGKKQGVQDERYLWPEVIRVIRESKPNWIILENVPGIIPHIDAILEDLESEAYTWWGCLIPASAVGAPHKRERLWIVANRNGDRCDGRRNHRKERSLPVDWQQYIKTLHAEWSQFQPESWTTFNAQEWLGVTSDTSSFNSSKRTADLSPNTERPERENITAKVRDVISDTDCVTKQQTDQRIKASSTAWSGHSRTDRDYKSVFNWEENQPPIPGVDVRVSERLDFLNRNKAIGNCVVPQIPYLFFRIILEIESGFM